MNLSSRVAVLMPAYNAQADLERSLLSLVGDIDPQDILVVDDGSSTPMVAPADAPARILRLEKNRGIVGALNAGLELLMAEGYDYIARLDAGDLSVPGRLAAQRTHLDANAAVALIGGAAHYVDMAGKPLFEFMPPVDDAGIRRKMRFNSAFVHPAVMMRVSALRECGVYDAAYQYAEDYELFARLMTRYQAANLPGFILTYEVNPGGISLSRRRELLRQRWRVQRRYHDPASPWSWLGLAQTAVIALVPVGWVNRLKQALGKMG